MNLLMHENQDAYDYFNFSFLGRDFIAPCKCRDTSKYVHRECPNQWRVVKEGFAFSHCTTFQLVMALLGYSVYKIDAHQRFWLRLHCGFGSELGFCYVCGEVLDFCAKSIILKLADWMIVASGGAYDTKNLQECIGSAVIAMGPEKLFAMLPISLNTKDYSLSNSWLIPVLNKYVCGSSLGFFMKHVVPLAVSFEPASSKGKYHYLFYDREEWSRDKPQFPVLELKSCIQKVALPTSGIKFALFAC
ncbi:RRP12-like protein isoform X3 [Capsicum annuum]|uniref:RRP12-like protein isoform X3 n=1 Tax=Capsicum annuum TaxID=4072 RepID=UPI0007BFB1E5|nr:RRP12-like protein isoform X3 [Capsicum annuum]